MSSQIPCKDLDRENTNLIDEEVHLMADLNSAGDRTDLGIPGMRKVFGYLLLVATGKPQSCENWSITNDKIFCCLNIYVFRFSSKIRSFQFLNTICNSFSQSCFKLLLFANVYYQPKWQIRNL